MYGLQDDSAIIVHCLDDTSRIYAVLDEQFFSLRCNGIVD